MSIIPRCRTCGDEMFLNDDEQLCPNCTRYTLSPIGRLEYVRWEIAALRAEERRLERIVASLPSQARPSEGD